MSRALPWLCLLVAAADPKSWCQVKNDKCTGQRRSFNGSSESSSSFSAPHLDLWERVIDYPEVRKTNGVRLADWDLDGDLDIIVADRLKTWDIFSDQPWQLSVLEQLANGSFIPHRTAIVDLDNFEVADWDSDGKMDVLVCHAQNEHVIVSRLDFSPSSPEVILNTSRVLPSDSSRACGFKMHAVDFDHDGDLDLILGDDKRSVGTLFEHISPPRYFERISPGEVIERQSPNPIAGMITKNESVRLEKIVDFDGDGRLDVLLLVNERCYYGCRFDILYLHQAADGTFVEPIENPFADITFFSEAGSKPSIEIADWNLDGLPDLFLISGGSRGHPRYFEQVVHQSVLSHSDFNPFRYIDLSHCEELHVADVNSDGQADLVIAHNDCNGIWGPDTSSSARDPSKLRLYLYETGLNMKEVTGAFQNVTETELGPFRVALVDWDQDGDSDLLVAAFDGRVHYHEMIEGKWQEETELAVSANVTFPVPPIPQYTRSAHLMVQPVPVDWDNDGDIDLVLGPEGWYWERLADGTLLEYPLEQSPLRNLSHDKSAAWRFVDCDLDGDWDVVVAPLGYSTMWACEHKGSSLKCDPNFRCLGMNLTDFGTDKHGSVYSFDFADMDGDQRPELVAMQRRDSRIGLWSAGFCTPPDACHKKGICQPHSEACACIAGHELHDCSGCEPHFYSILRAEIGHLHDCKACPGAGGEVCHSRGVCFDDSRVKALAKSSTAAFMAIGNGSCNCSEAHFGGVDEAGRQNCLEGNCPAGTEENDGQCHPCRRGYMSTEGGTCRACAQGTFALRNGSQCESCPVGMVAEKAGSSACSACPAGKYERLRQFCSDCSPGTISAAGSQCESCSVGMVAEKAGSVACSACPAGKHEERRQFCSACAPGTMSAAGSSSCTTCKAGFHAASPGSSACEICAAGTFSEEGSPKCASCSPGTVSEAASATCSPCKAGQIARNSLTCEACPVGTYAPERSTLCRACPHRHVSGAESSSCQLCESIFFRVLPDDRRERCTVSPLDIAFALTAWMALTCFVMSFLVGCYSKLAVEDLSVQGEKLAVTTSLPHCFLRWDWASPEVYFTCTGVPDLDGANTWKGKAQSIDELSLQSEKSIERQLDTSMGYLHVKFPMAFIMMGLWSVPLVFWCALFLGASVACLSQLLWPLILVVCCLGLIVGALAFFAWRRRGRHTSLAKRRRQFLRDLSGGPQPCDRGPQRSITAGKLQDFLQFFQAFIKERSMYYVCGNIVKPLTEPFQVSFVELVGPVNIQWFISHSWQMAVRHFSDSIFKHAQSYQKSWRESAYWICTFSNSQWHVKAELGNGRWQESSFYLSLISPDCKGTAMIIDELVQPLQRIWCLFEVYQTICLSRNGRSQGLLLCTSTGVLQEGNAGTDVAVAVARKIAHLDTRVAEATNEADRMMIHALIEQMPGGFDAMNSFVGETISDALKSSHLQYEKAFADLVHDLNDPVSTSAPPLPTLLTTHAGMAGPERQKDNG